MSQMESSVTAGTGNSNTKQRQIAQGCELTVLTESPPFVHHDDSGVSTALRRMFGDPLARYDLLSVPSLKHLLKDKDAVEMLAEDILVAVSLHRVEKLLVATSSIEPRRVIQRLKEHGALRDRLRMKGFTLQRPARFEHRHVAALTCMDWRLHGAGGFIPLFAKAYGVARFDLIAMTGVAEELAIDSVRCRAIGDQLELAVAKGLGRLVLVAHTDCGKYGGDRSFPDQAARSRTLCADLDAARERLRSRFPKLRIDVAVARIEGNALAALDPCGNGC